MTTYTLTFLDTARIQEYIFGSNVLRENIGASELVRRATRQWPLEEVRRLGRTNVKPDRRLSGEPDDLNEGLRIDRDGLDAEVIFAGGGNCAILFADITQARSFATSLSRRVVAQAPELELVVVHLDVDWASDVLSAKVKEALDGLVTKKLSRRVSTPVLGLGTTVACQSTGLPAVGSDDLGRPLSANILTKLRVVEDANARLRRLFPQFETAELDIPYDFDNFGRQTGDISYIAVVHADGNGMGDRLERVRARFTEAKQNAAYVEALRGFSRAVEESSQQALETITTLLLRHWRPAEDAIAGQAQDGWGRLVSAGKIQLAKGDRERLYVPFRPLVFGGDDLTFVCDGRLGLTLTAAYLAAYEQAMQHQKNEFVQGLQGCAGIAVVKAHYPFSRAYELADDLCRNAKETWKRECSALDWHFAATGLFGDIAEIRRRQYTSRDGSLAARPLPLQKQAGKWQSWEGFSQVVKAFLLDEDWKDHRNKVIGLRQALRDGARAVAQFRHAYGLEQLPLLNGGEPALQASGWDGRGRCGYFDAVEALDFFLPLEG